MAPAWFLTLSLFAHAAAAKAPRPEAPGECPADARVEVNLAAWSAALTQAQGQPDEQKRRDDVLAELGLALDLPESDGASGPRVSLLGVDDTAVALTAGGRPDHVVEVRYRVEGADDGAIFLVQVLRPLEGRRYCALGTALSRRDDAGGTLATYKLAFVPLLDARTKAIEVERAVAQLRENDTFREYWVVRGIELRKVFDQRIGSMTSPEGGASATSRSTTTVGKIALVGGFPKRLELTEITKRGGCEVRAGDAPCDDSEPTTTTTFAYDGARYVRRR